MRLFLAVDVGAAATPALTRACATVREAAGTAGARRGSTVGWVDPSRMHLTLHFFGEVDARDVPGLTEVLAAPIARPPFEIELGRVGVFPPSGPVRVVWLGCSRGREDLAALHRLTAERLASIGRAVESRPFSPHLTLGRVRGRVPDDFRARVTTAVVPTVGPWTVSDVTLYQSHLGPSGARYAVVNRTRLAS